MITLLINLKAFCVTALSVCLGLAMFGSGLHAQAQEVKSTATDEQRRGSEEANEQPQQDQQSSTAPKDHPTTINKRPLQDWLRKAEELKRQGQLDLNEHFSLVVTADRLVNGELKNLQIESHEGDPRLLDSAKLFIAALSESRIFSLFEDVERLGIELRLNESAAHLNASLEAASPDLAKRHATTYQALFNMARLTRRGQTEAIFYNHSKISANGKQLIFTITIPRQVLGELLDVKPSAP